MNSIEDDRGIFGPDERVQMQRNSGIRIEIPEPSITPANINGAIPPAIHLDGGLAFYPGEEPQSNAGSIARTMQQIHELSNQIVCTDAFEHGSTVHQMAQL